MKKLIKCKNCKNCYGDSEIVKFKCNVTKEVIENYENEIECSDYDNKFIEYPIEVSKITKDDRPGIEEDFIPTGSLVKVRPCKKEYNNKTFLGIYLGRIDIGLYINHSPDTKELRITRHFNPAIFVPEIKEIIFGCESWWGVVKNEAELKAITDDDIDNVWYVKLLKSMNQLEAHND